MYVGCLPVELDPDEQDVRPSSASFYSKHRWLC